MNTKQKTRNFRNEYRHNFILNLGSILIILALAYFRLPESGAVGIRTMGTLYMIDGILTMMFMVLLEKYAIAISGFYERMVITVLSNLYVFVIMSMVNFIFFMSYQKFLVDACVMVVKMVVVLLTDFFMGCVYNNSKWYQKPKLLIIDSKPENFARMKRIKYGVMNKYDSWYETVSYMDNKELEIFMKEKFQCYDAICVLDGLSRYKYEMVLKYAMKLNMDVYIVPKMVDVGRTNARLVRLDDVLTLYMPKAFLSQIELAIKRVLDIILALVGLIVAIIPMIIIAIVIKLTSPGPIFYKQARLTKSKKEFYIYKFRTMIPDAEKLSGPKFSEKNDSRITPVGKILRACRMDELPQLFNILKGEMSVVGPRPERPMFVEMFEKEIENYDYRFAVKAGLTSLSHVYGRYSTYIHDRTYYDLFYITHYSLFLDFKIILLTTKTIFLKTAAEGEDDFKEKTVIKTDLEGTND